MYQSIVIIRTSQIILAPLHRMIKKSCSVTNTFELSLKVVQNLDVSGAFGFPNLMVFVVFSLKN